MKVSRKFRTPHDSRPHLWRWLFLLCLLSLSLTVPLETARAVSASDASAETTPTNTAPAGTTSAGDEGAARAGGASNAHGTYDPDRPIVLVVTASRIPLLLEDTPAVVEVIPTQQLTLFGGHDIAAALRNTSTVSIESYGRTASSTHFSLRGAPMSQVLILVDGLPIDTVQGVTHLADVPATAIERVEVVRGPGSAVWGSRAAGGVINIITLDSYRAPRWDVQVRGGPGWTLQAIHSDTTAGGTGYVLSAQNVRDDGHRKNSDLSSTYLAARIDRPLSPYTDLTLRINHTSAERGVPGSVTRPTPNARQQDDQLRWSAELRGEGSLFARRGDYHLQAYGLHYERSFREDPSLPSRSLNDALGLEGSWQTRLATGALHIGLSLRHDRTDSTNLSPRIRERFSSALAGEVVHDLSERLLLTAGIRLDTSSAHHPEYSPRVGLRYKSTPRDSYRATVGRVFRYPSFNDLYWYEPPVRGNPNLRPEHGWSAEIGGDHRLSDRAQVSWTVFYRRMTDLIAWVGTEPENIAQSRTQGIELSGSYSLSDALTATFRYTFLDALDLDTGKPIASLPAHEAAVGLAGDTDAFRWAAVGRYRSERRGLPPYFVTDATVGRSIGRGVELRLEVENLFDVQYAERPGYPLPGRTIWLRLGYEL